MTMEDAQSLILSRREFDENPPKTMLWMAPILAQASMEKASSGIMGR